MDTGKDIRGEDSARTQFSTSDLLVAYSTWEGDVGEFVDEWDAKAQVSTLREYASKGNASGLSDAEGMGWLRAQADEIECRAGQK